MVDYVMHAPGWALLALVASFLLMRFLSRGLMVSELDSLGLLNIMVAFSVSLLTAFYVVKAISVQDFVSVITLIACFYGGIYLVSVVADLPSLKKSATKALPEVFHDDRRGRVYLLIAVALFLALNGYVWDLMRFATGIDERQFIFMRFRWVDVLLRGLNVLLPYLTIGFYAVTKRKWFAAVAVIAAISGVSGGTGKGFLIPWMLAYFTFDGMLVKRAGLFAFIKKMNAVLVALAGVVATLLIWGLTATDALRAVMDRLFANGDLYFWSLVAGNYSHLWGYYHFWSYLLHPFTAIFGIRAYDFPIGSRIIGTAGVRVTGLGPNPHLPILLLVLLNGDLLECAACSVLFGAFVGLSRVQALKLLSKKSLPGIWRVSIFALFFGAVPGLFPDVGSFEMMLISIAVLTVALSVLAVPFRGWTKEKRSWKHDSRQRGFFEAKMNAMKP